jgi:hypothetical protein
MPSILSSFPHPITEIENTFITLSDGTKLAARIWLPTNAEQNPVPAILEYLPYRKNDGTIVRDFKQMPYFAGHGYAAIRVDMRGSGDSDGILYDEYLKQEQDDALEVIEWIASQNWCTGKVGMWGISWGGFNALQIAARRPPALKAIIPLCFTDDRYADDVHYMGGCLLGTDMPAWASIMLAYNAVPPDPRFRSDWREVWFDRMDKTPPYLNEWLTHQRRDSFWGHGSVCEDYSAINIPVFAVGGWVDAYTNAIFRVLENLNVPRLGLVGPWAHLYPEFGIPGPQIGFLQEALRWWDHWLKDLDTGIMNEPFLRAYVQESFPPQNYYAERPGQWVALDSWPSPTLIQSRYHLSDAGLSTEPNLLTPRAFASPQHTGLAAGAWCPYGKSGDYPLDQRADDALSICFNSPILYTPISLLGFPELTLTLSSSHPNALIAARLCDVAPDGASTLITWGLLNLTHRDSHANPQPLTPNLQFSTSLKLNAIGYTIPAGHILRLALSNTYWPHAWPSPEPVILTLHSGELTLLTLASDHPTIQLPNHLSEPEIAAPVLTQSYGQAAPPTRTITHDTLTHTYTLVEDDGLGRENAVTEYLPARVGVAHRAIETRTITDGQPLSAVARCQHNLVHTFASHKLHIRIVTDTTLTADAENFHTLNTLEAYENDVRVFVKTWSYKVKRDLV